MAFESEFNAYFVNVGGNFNGKVFADDGEFEKARSILRDHYPHVNIKGMQPSECIALITTGQLTKRDVFVLSRFTGDIFRQLQQTKALIVGPPCLMACVLHSMPVPANTTPVYTTAMRNLRISATGLTTKEKDYVRESVQWMGGLYCADFGLCITHLVSNTISSNKYEQATLSGVPVMHVDWVQRVWERSCVENVNAADKEFHKYTLPLFFGTNITSSGLTTEMKNQVSQLVNDNGGTYHSCFRSQVVDILITEKNKTDSEKFMAAVRYKKNILLPEWIIDSVTKGYALPMKNYEVKKLNASTPTKSQQSLADFTVGNSSHLSDISRISAVGSTRPNLMNTVNETICSNVSEKYQTPSLPAAQPSARGPSSSKKLHQEVLKKGVTGASYKQILDEISPKMARNAGAFLDGCSIFLSGFRAEEREKLVRILNTGGATRYDAVNEKITHIIVGKLSDDDYKSWKKEGILTGCHVVSLHWLLDSIKLKQPASEVVHRVLLPTARAPETPSPSSKRTLRSMNHSFKQPDKPVKKKLFDNNDNDVHQPQSVATNATHSISEPDTATAPGAIDDDEHTLITQYSQEHMNAGLDTVPLPVKRSTINVEQAANNTTMHAPPIASSTLCAPTGAVSTIVPTAAQPPASLTNETELTDIIDYENLNFLEGVTVYVYEAHFRDEFYSQILYECEAAKGGIVNSTFRDTVDYAIVSFEHTLDLSMLPIKANHVVNELYVETCLKLNKFIPILYYHKHIPHTADTHPLKGMTIVVSTYCDLERDFVDSIVELLGARLNKTFVKKEKPLLVCPLPEGSKYQGAIKWGYPVVTSEWLLHCAVEGKKLPYQPYLVGESVADFPISPRLRERNSDSIDKIRQGNGSLDKGSSIESVENQNNLSKETAVKEALPIDITPLRNRRVSQLAGTTRVQHNYNESPCTPTNQLVGPSYDIEIMEAMLLEIEDEGQRACWREIINEIRNNPTPQLDRIRRQACTPNNNCDKWPSPKGIPEFCTTPAFKQRMCDEFERRYRLPIKQIPPDTPIEEICRRVLYATCKTHGIQLNNVDDGYDKHQEQQQAQSTAKNTSVKTNDTKTTPVQRANASLVFTAPRVLFEPKTSSNDNAFVPDTQSPSTSKQHATTGNVTPNSLMGRSTIDFDKISFEDTQLTAGNIDSNPSTSALNKSTAKFSPEVKQITDYLKSCETRRQSLKRSAALEDEPPYQMSKDNIPETEGHFVHAFESEQFGGTEEMVGWQDPAQFSASRRSTIVSQMQYKGTPCFSISCAHEPTKQDIIIKIQKLGGKICENLLNFDENCTHFLCERPNRGEKSLACISSGKWVLSLRYIEESYSKNNFIDEELFEWGNCKAINMPQLNAEEQVIGLAAHRWRRELSETNAGAFSGIRAILRISERHLNSLKVVIKAGKGEIVDAQSPYSCKNQAHLATHCFVDQKRNRLNREDYDFLISKNVKVLTQMYINEYLMNIRNIDCAQFEVKL